MDVEHIVRSFPVDGELKEKVAALEAEGYEIIPGIPPVIVYHLARTKKPPEEHNDQPHSLGKLTIDDSLITVIKAGEQR